MSSGILHPSGFFNNAPNKYSHIRVVPLSAAMGAEIVGVDIADMSEQAFLEVRDTLFKHKMIYFRDQEISRGEQEVFTRRFGEFGIDAYTTGTEKYKNVQPVVKEADTTTRMIFGSGWHTDSPFLATPPSISMLYGVEVPPYGGDTIWCNAALAYQALSPTMQTVISTLKVHMSAREVVSVLTEIKASTLSGSPGKVPGAFGNMELDMNSRKIVEGAFHPLVRTHPDSAEKSLYVDQTYARGIEGMTEQESTPLLAFLVGHLTQPAFSCRLRWHNNTFVMWDNRLCVHQAFNDYDGFRREMYRTTVLGETPV